MRSEPIVESLDPLVNWQFLFGHAKTVAAFRVDMQLERIAGGLPLEVGRHTDNTWNDWVVVGTEDEKRNRIGRRSLWYANGVLAKKIPFDIQHRNIFFTTLDPLQTLNRPT